MSSIPETLEATLNDGKNHQTLIEKVFAINFEWKCFSEQALHCKTTHHVLSIVQKINIAVKSEIFGPI